MKKLFNALLTNYTDIHSYEYKPITSNIQRLKYLSIIILNLILQLIIQLIDICITTFFCILLGIGKMVYVWLESLIYFKNTIISYFKIIIHIIKIK